MVRPRPLWTARCNSSPQRLENAVGRCIVPLAERAGGRLVGGAAVQGAESRPDQDRAVFRGRDEQRDRRASPIQPGARHAELRHRHRDCQGPVRAGDLQQRHRWGHTRRRRRTISPSASAPIFYKLVRAYSKVLGFGIGAHALRATAATNVLDHQADIAKVQEWLGHANIATTRIYDHRRTRAQDSPTFNPTASLIALR